MESAALKKYLIQVADQLTPESTLEDVIEQLSLLADIDESENDEALGNVISQDDLEKKSKEWLK
ncbi:hypothetical protein KIH41_13175 [Litoribacter ruber]|uniref:hypothetical protein n=1 Tax=Litoribacter TaxID=1237104 RepID=UPI00117C8B8B|nr:MULTISPECIES: hypothetical protein [Litoribacter]MBT0812231.1 hypothetical protein [Litoribacter ruber]